MSSSSRRTSPVSSTTGGSEFQPLGGLTSGEPLYTCRYCSEVCAFVFPRPFRRVTDKGALLWDRIHRLEKGKIYKQVFLRSSATVCTIHCKRKKTETKKHPNGLPPADGLQLWLGALFGAHFLSAKVKEGRKERMELVYFCPLWDIFT